MENYDILIYPSLPINMDSDIEFGGMVMLTLSDPQTTIHSQYALNIEEADFVEDEYGNLSIGIKLEFIEGIVVPSKHSEDTPINRQNLRGFLRTVGIHNMTVNGIRDHSWFWK